MNTREARKAIVVANAYCTIPDKPTTGQMLKALNALYDRAYEDGVDGRLEEGERIFKELMETAHG